MGISERKEREKVKMRSLILQEATHMFIEHGIEKTSIRSIADKIEYSPGTIYLYFKDKDEIMFAIHEQGFNLLLSEMQKTKKIKDPFDRFCKLAEVYINFAFTNPEYYDLMFIMKEPLKNVKNLEWPLGYKSYQFLRDVIKECLEKDLMKSIEPDLAALSAWSFMHGLISLNIRKRLGIYNHQQIKELTDQSIKMMTGLFKK